MGPRVGSLGLAVYRLVKGGEAGLNLSLTDLFGKRIEFPSLWDVLKTFFTRKSIQVRLVGESEPMIRSLLNLQKRVDEQVENEIKKAKSGTK